MTKSESRVPPCYKKGTKDWKDQMDMLLDDGATCADCHHAYKCTTCFGQKETDDRCQFHPNRFLQRKTP